MQDIKNDEEIYQYFRLLKKSEMKQEVKNRLKKVKELETKLRYLEDLIRRLNQVADE